MNKGSRYYKKYYNYILKNKKISDENLMKVFDIINDLSDRRGLRQEWESIDFDIQDEIIDTWKDILDKKD